MVSSRITQRNNICIDNDFFSFFYMDDYTHINIFTSSMCNHLHLNSCVMC